MSSGRVRELHSPAALQCALARLTADKKLLSAVIFNIRRLSTSRFTARSGPHENPEPLLLQPASRFEALLTCWYLFTPLRLTSSRTSSLITATTFPSPLPAISFLFLLMQLIGLQHIIFWHWLLPPPPPPPLPPCYRERCWGEPGGVRFANSTALPAIFL